MSARQPEIPEYERDDAAPRDGIGEDDHGIPLWFNLGFYGLIAVGIAYILYYTLSGWSSRGQYDAQLAAAALRAEAVRAALPAANPYRGDAAAVREGAQVYATICAACHKPDGSGLVGPSLVDPYWKYGNSDAVLFQTVSEGRPGGMPPWKTLGSEKIWKALAYIETLPKSDAPGMGAPDFAPNRGG
ncbi:MAG: c-type cytochrome [Myxococcales bacterium]|nr:c-type cytochrome [Myxococcales bacterium]MDH5307312.1 c-type cytochrome [Myxococcales bacterium]